MGFPCIIPRAILFFGHDNVSVSGIPFGSNSFQVLHRTTMVHDFPGFCGSREFTLNGGIIGVTHVRC